MTDDTKCPNCGRRLGVREDSGTMFCGPCGLSDLGAAPQQDPDETALPMDLIAAGEDGTEISIGLAHHGKGITLRVEGRDETYVIATVTPRTADALAGVLQANAAWLRRRARERAARATNQGGATVAPPADLDSGANP